METLIIPSTEENGLDTINITLAHVVSYELLWSQYQRNQKDLAPTVNMSGIVHERLII